MNHTQDYLTSIGVDPARFARDGWDRQGYYEIQMEWGCEVVSKYTPWPGEFDALTFLFAVVSDLVDNR